jgi:hypothetical protein
MKIGDAVEVPDCVIVAELESNDRRPICANTPGCTTTVASF